MQSVTSMMQSIFKKLMWSAWFDIRYKCDDCRVKIKHQCVWVADFLSDSFCKGGLTHNCQQCHACTFAQQWSSDVFMITNYCPENSLSIRKEPPTEFWQHILSEKNHSGCWVVFLTLNANTECLSHIPGSHSVCAVRTLFGIDRKILSVRKEPMLSSFLTLKHFIEWENHLPTIILKKYVVIHYSYD